MTDLESLPTEQLRQLAFDKAERDKDRGFLWELAKHTRGAHAIAGEDGSSGGITGSISEAVHVIRELMGKEPMGDDEPLLRARFLDYLGGQTGS
ncbi:MAG: hypothetical protein JWN88_1786 [Frankiales bacterium]|nr:hypothetical protein [Frankiales bacterium]